MLLDTDYQALIKSVDLGDDSVLPILADWLEEHDDRRCVGIRRIIELGLRPIEQTDMRYKGLHSWYASCRMSESSIYGEVFVELGDWGVDYCNGIARDYQHRHTAYLDLARVLAKEES